MSTPSRPNLYQRLLGRITFEKYTELVFLLSTVVGISPLVFDNGKPRLSLNFLFYSIFITSTVLYFKINDFFHDIPDFPIKFHRNIFWANNLFWLLQPIVYLSTSILSSRKLKNIRYCLRSVDSLLGNVGICQETDHVSLWRILYFQPVFAMCLGLFIPNTPIETGIDLFVYITYFLGVEQYSALEQEFSYHLRRIVRCLRRMKERTDQTGQAERLVLLSKAHHRLCSSIEEFSWCYGFQILNIIISQFLSTILTLFYFLFYYFLFDDHVMYWVLVVTLPLMIANFMIIDCSAKISEQSKEVNLLLYHLMIKDKSYELLNNERLLLHISMKREVDLTVCGLFNLDYTLLHAMLAAIATYLVVMFQFV
ncbi:Gustatory receptor 37 [Halyomorpha halys]|nr:Gustatory receptor 37 [Halyomorpha halys]